MHLSSIWVSPDFKILQSGDNAEYAKSVEALQNVRKVVEAFFDASLLKHPEELKTLRGADSPVSVIPAR